MAAGADNGPKVPGREARAPFPKRFYKAVTVSSFPRVRGEGTGAGPAAGFQILLDGKPIRTPAKALLAVPTRALAEAIAAEWQEVPDKAEINVSHLRLTRLAATAIDRVTIQRERVIDDTAKYA